MTSPEPLRVAVVNDYEIVVAGVAAALEPFGHRVQVVELDAGLPVVADVDLILYDTFGQTQGDGIDLEDLVRGGSAKVVVFSWNVQPDLVQRTLSRGAAGYLSKQLSAEQIVDALERVQRGEWVGLPGSAAEEKDRGVWPGREAGLSAREAEVIALIAQGMSNQEVADRTYLSINSVKTYIRSAYRKMGVGSRSQAVIWGVQHGFGRDRSRLAESDLA